MKVRVYGYAASPQPIKWKGPFYSKELAVSDARVVYPKASGFYLVEGEIVSLRDYIPDPERLTDMLLEELWMVADEKGIDASAFPEVAHVQPPARDELRSLVLGWVAVHLANGWIPTGTPEFCT